MIHKVLPLFLVLLVLISCASRGISIDASTPSRIELNGQTLCDVTPCTFSEVCWTHGGELILEAYPLDKTKGYTQKKNLGLYRCDVFVDNSRKVYFEMDARVGVSLEESDVRLKKNISLESHKEEKLILLKKLLEEGKITNKAYEDQVREILK